PRTSTSTPIATIDAPRRLAASLLARQSVFASEADLLPAVIKTKFSLTSNALIVCRRCTTAGNRPFWVNMMGQPRKRQRPKVLFRPKMLCCFVYATGLVAGLIPTIGHAQTSIDAGKSPSEIFSTVCATCHKSRSEEHTSEL